MKIQNNNVKITYSRQKWYFHFCKTNSDNDWLTSRYYYNYIIIIDVIITIVSKNKASKNGDFFTISIKEVINEQFFDEKYLDVVMLISVVLEYGNNYAKMYENLYHFAHDEPNQSLIDLKPNWNLGLIEQLL